MNCFVYLKQIQREGLEQEGRFLEYSDKNALMEALNLRDKFGGTVTAIAMGAEQGEKVLKEVYTYGVDRAVFVAYEEEKTVSITKAAMMLAQAIKKLDGYDIIVCGRQAIDGDGAHMAGLVSYYLELPFISEVKEVRDRKGEAVEVIKETEEESLVLHVQLPAVLLLNKEKIVPRYPKMQDIIKAYNGTYVVEKLDGNQLSEEIESFCPIEEVEHIVPKEERTKTMLWIQGKDEEEKGKNLLNYLRENKLLE